MYRLDSVTPEILDFARTILTKDEVEGRSVLEVGACDVNGSVRSIVTPLGPLSYIGVDIEDGPGVDEVIPGDQLVKRFGENAFDIVICTEVLEHVREWRPVISNLKQVLRTGGRLFFTVPSPGFPYHAFPNDYWRYEPDDLKRVFADLEIRSERTMSLPGVGMWAEKPPRFAEIDLSEYRLWSVLYERRVRRIGPLGWTQFRARNSLRYRLRSLRRRPPPGLTASGQST
jgi:SAM-dependent methyltransferase